MGISDHWGKPKPFSSDCLVTENQKSIANAAIFFYLSQKQRTKFSHFDVLINVFTTSPLNGVSSRFLLNHIINNCVMSSNTFRHIMLNGTSSRLQSTSRKIKSNVTVISQMRRSIFQ